MSDSEKIEKGPLDSLFGLIDTVADELARQKKPDPSRRPSEVWIRWRILPDAGPNAIELIGCTEKPLAEPLGENEHEGRFR